MKTKKFEKKADADTQYLEATKISLYVNNILTDDFLTAKGMREAIKNIFVEYDKLVSYLQFIRKIEENGKQPYEVSGFLSDFRIELIKQYHFVRLEPPNLTGVGLMSFADPHRRIDRLHLVDNVFVMGQIPGTLGTIYGPMGAGKTDIGVSEIYRCSIKQKNTRVDTNIPIFDNVEEKTSYSLKLSSTLLNCCYHTINGLQDEEYKAPYPMIWIYDEGQFSRDRTKATANRQIFQKQVTILSRKFGIFQWIVYQEEKPPDEVKSFATHRIEKVSLSNKSLVDLDIKSPVVRAKYKIKNLPGWEQRKEKNLDYFEYQSYTPHVYTIDVNPLRMIDYITSIASEKMIPTAEHFENIIEYIKKHKGERLDIISDDITTVLLYRIRERLLLSDDPIDKKVRTIRYLSKMVGWKHTTLQSRLERVKADIDKGLIIDAHTDDVVKDIAESMEFDDTLEKDIEQHISHEKIKRKKS